MDVKRTKPYLIYLVMSSQCLVTNIASSTTFTTDQSSKQTTGTTTTTEHSTTTPTTRQTTTTFEESAAVTSLTTTTTWTVSPTTNLSFTSAVPSSHSSTSTPTLTSRIMTTNTPSKGRNSTNETLTTFRDHSESPPKTNTETVPSSLASMGAPVSSLSAQTSETSSIISSTGISNEPLTQGAVLLTVHQECLNTVSGLRQDRAVILGVLLAMCVILFLLLMAACLRIKRLGESVFTIHKKYDINNSRDLWCTFAFKMAAQTIISISNSHCRGSSLRC